ncbi:hypothetical protein KKF91_02720 [Myxococcota bacterium]|nr:hypothetical protein [Myxococcota bacterium]MBU1429453.1 hypothetical protein [Myxococcota bacterium]MBU1897472.1 hypothetical protein [Myxococcota bacterium]
MRTLFLTLLCLTLGASSASALGKFGVRLGTGTSFIDYENEPADGAPEPDITPLAVGLAWRFDLAVVGVEIDGLWWQNTSSMEMLGKTYEATETRLALPIIGRVNFPLIPVVLDLNVGAGLEPRFLLSAEDQDGKDTSDDLESMVIYMPIAVGATISAGPLALQAELRYERQITEYVKDKEGVSKNKIHQLMFFAGAFF